MLCDWCRYEIGPDDECAFYRGKELHLDCAEHLVYLDQADMVYDAAQDAALDEWIEAHHQHREVSNA